MRRPSPRLLLSALVAAAASGCALTPPAPTPSARTTEIAVPDVRQTGEGDCGVATMQALAASWDLGLPAEEAARLRELSDEQLGLRGADLRAALQAAGMNVWVYRGLPDDSPTGLWRQIEDGRPTLVALATGEDTRHFVLVVGHDPETGAVIVQDPMRGRVVMDGERFLACWEQAERFTLLAVAPVTPVAPAGAGAADAATPTVASLDRGLDAEELASLTSADLASPELGELRAGFELSDREIKLMAGTAIVVIILALIL